MRCKPELCQLCKEEQTRFDNTQGKGDLTRTNRNLDLAETEMQYLSTS
jgi:hypothetical protein